MRSKFVRKRASKLGASWLESDSNSARKLDIETSMPEPANDPSDDSFGFRRAAEKVRSFPQTPGIYLMKDQAGRVIYVGKAKNLRSRAGSYFLKAAQQDERTAGWIG